MDYGREGIARVCERLKSEVPLLEYAGTLTNLTKRGTVYVGCCPLPDHDDRTPSFTVWPEGSPAEQSWWCFGCDRGSDVIDLHALIGGHAEMWSAMVSLSEMYGVELPGRSEGWKQGESRKAAYREAGTRLRGRVLARRVYALEVLPVVQAINDERERERELRRTWREWQAELPWARIAEEFQSVTTSVATVPEAACVGDLEESA